MILLNKKLLVLTIFIISLLAISAVNAADNATDDVVGMEETDNGIVNVVETTDVAGVENVNTYEDQSDNLTGIYSQYDDKFNLDGNTSVDDCALMSYHDSDVLDWDDGPNAKIEVINSVNEFKNGNFAFKLVNITDNTPISGATLSLYTIGNIRAGYSNTTNNEGIAVFRTADLYEFDQESSSLIAKPLEVGNHAVELSTSGTIKTTKVTTDLTITKANINITIDNLKEYWDTDKVAVTVKNENNGEPVSKIILHVHIHSANIEYYMQTSSNGAIQVPLNNLVGNYTIVICNNDTENINFNSVSEEITIDKLIGTFDELSSLIENTSEGGILELKKDYKYVNGSTDGIQINKAITIDGKGHTLDGNQLSRIFTIDGNNVHLKNLIFNNGNSTTKGGAVIWSGSEGILDNCTFINCSTRHWREYSSNGGAVYWQGSNGIISNSKFVDCYTTLDYSFYGSGGGVYAYSENFLIVNSSFINCYSGYGGGLYWRSNNAIMINCSFSNCSGITQDKSWTTEGNAIYLCANNCTIYNSSFKNNHQIKPITNNGGFGGVLYSCSKNFRVYNSYFENNSAASGGVFYFYDAENIIIANCNFVNNSGKNKNIYILKTDYVNISHSKFIELISKTNDIGISDSNFVNISYCEFIKNMNDSYASISLNGEYNYFLYLNKYSKDFGNVEGGYTIITRNVLNLTFSGAEYNYGNNNFSVLLTDELNNPLINKSVSIKFFNTETNKVYAGKTNHLGILSVGSDLILNAGEWNVTINFEGNDNYAPYNATTKITVFPLISSVTIDDINGTKNHKTTLVANVISDLMVDEGFVTFFDGQSKIGEAKVVDGVASLTYTPTTDGEHTITAVFSSSNYLTSNSTAKLVVDSLTIEILPVHGVVGYDGSLVAKVKGLYSIINEGSVSFYVNNDFVGKIFVVDGIVSFVYTPLIAGNNILKAVYGDSDRFSDAEYSTNYLVSQATSQLVINEINAKVGDDLTLTASITSPNGLTVNEGTVTFMEDGNLIGTADVINGVASIDYSPTRSGNHVISASFIGDNYLNSSSVLNVFVEKAVSQIAFYDIAKVSYASPSTISIDILSNSKKIREGSVKFYIGNQDIGQYDVRNGRITLDYTSISVGTFTILAVFDETANYLSSNATTMFVVDKADSKVSITPVNGTANHDLTLTVIIQSSNNLTVNEGSVTFMDGSNVIGVTDVVNGVANLVYNPVIDGRHEITAKYIGNNYLGSDCISNVYIDSIEVQVQVDISIVGFNSTFVSKVKGLYSIINEGSVSFYVNNELVGKSVVANGVASLVYTPMIAGNNILKAVYGDSERFSDEESSTNYIVNQANSRIIINEFNAAVGDILTLSANITSPNGLIINEGTVTFMEDGKVIGLAYVVDGVAGLTYTPTKSGIHIISASFLGNNYLASNNVLNVFVEKAMSQIVFDDIANVNYASPTAFSISILSNNKTITEGAVKFYINNQEIKTSAVGNGYITFDYKSASAGTFTVSAVFDETANYLPSDATATFTVDKLATKLTVQAVSTVYNAGKYLVVTLRDSAGNPIKGVKVTIKLSNGKTANPTTDKNGQAKLTTDGLVPKIYSATVKFAGNANYKASSASVKVTVKKDNTKIIASSKAFKVSATKKVTATLKDSKNRVIKSRYVTFKVAGKTYKVKTNSKGVATAIVKIAGKGSFATAVSFAGDAYYNKCSKSIKIIVK